MSPRLWPWRANWIVGYLQNEDHIFCLSGCCHFHIPNDGVRPDLQKGQLFVVVKGTVTFVRLSDIAGKSEESIKGIVVEKVTGTVTKALTAEALADAGVDIENLSDEALEAASEGDIAAALDEIANADIAGVAAAEAAEATKEAWANISQEDLAEATAYAA